MCLRKGAVAGVSGGRSCSGELPGLSGLPLPAPFSPLTLPGQHFPAGPSHTPIRTAHLPGHAATRGGSSGHGLSACSEGASSADSGSHLASGLPRVLGSATQLSKSPRASSCSSHMASVPRSPPSSLCRLREAGVGPGLPWVAAAGLSPGSQSLGLS